MILMMASCGWPRPAGAGDYELADPELKVTPIDSDPTESFLALQLDSAGRLFAGGREGLFVYEPAPHELYQPRKLLYRFPKDSWIGDIAICGNDLFVTTHTAVYRLEDAVRRRDDLRPQRLLWGMPPLAYFQEHQGFHALALGPEGDLYVCFGDNLIGYGDFKRPDHWGHWTFFHGHSSTPYTGVGGVIRISLDGERLTLFARGGLRNPCGLAFDANWDLFSNDNDHEAIPSEYVPGRLLHVTPHANFNWPRGWLVEKHPWRADLLDTLNPNLGRYVPTGQAYYNDTYFPARFRHCLYVAEWGKGVLPRYPLRPSGASFKADEAKFFAAHNNARPVGVAVGRGGRLFVTCLYMPGNEASPVVKSAILMITRTDDKANAPFHAYEETTAEEKKLRAELKNDSWSRRYRAHIELTRRGRISAGAPPAAYEALEADLASKDPRAAHAALIGIFDRFERFPFEPVRILARGDDTYLRQTAVQLLAEKATVDQLEKLCEAADAKDRLAGVLALGERLTVPSPTEPLPECYPSATPDFNPFAQYVGEKVDLRKLARLSNFTLADVWAKKTRTAEEERVFGLLLRRMNDANEQVAKQAAFFLRLLADPRADAAAAELLGVESDAIVKPIQGAVAATATVLPAEFRGLDWKAEAKAGRAETGRKLFDTLGCAKCHGIKPTDAGGGGPTLAGAGERFSVEYLAESILLPNKVVTPAFRWTALKLTDEEDVAGLVVGETDARLELLMVNATRRAFDKSRILSRQIEERSPMPEGLIQNRAQLRDLLAYLLSNQP